MELLGGFPPYGDKLRLRNAACQNKKPPCRVVSVLELLTRFELVTSSLPIIEKLLQLVVGYCALSLVALLLQGIRDFPCRVLLFPIVA